MAEKSSSNPEQGPPVTTAEGAVEHAHDLVARLMDFAPHHRSVKSAIDWVARLTKGLRPSRVKALYYREVTRPAYDEVAELEAVLERQIKLRSAYDTRAMNARLDGYSQEIDRIRAEINQAMERSQNVSSAPELAELGNEQENPAELKPVARSEHAQESAENSGLPGNPRKS